MLLEDKVVTTAAPGYGFFMQVHPNDADYVGVDYSAVFVYVGGEFTASEGDRVTVSGAVQGFFGQTQVALSGTETIESTGRGRDSPSSDLGFALIQPPIVA